MILPTASSLLFLLAIHRHLHLSQAVLLRGQENLSDAMLSTVVNGANPNHRMLPKGGNGNGNGPGGGGGGDGGCKIAGEKVGIYIGDGTGTSSKKWAQALAAFWQTGMRAPPGIQGDVTRLNSGRTTFSGDGSITYVTLTGNEMTECYSGELNALELLMMPGGSAYGIQDALGAAGKTAIRNYLDQGGNYVGFCAGGYYAARGYYWSGYDGAPADNCDEQFCRYEVAGTFSYDDGTEDFTEHEWGGTSYHSNLMAYGPLANVIVEGPIEEIAGPWAVASNPNAPYDSHVVQPTDPQVPLLRQIYYGGATENYIYTNTSESNWGTELAYFRSGSNDGDLSFPDNSLWTLKETNTASGGKIIISSAHIEASLFYTSIGDGGMTECQNYNNYVFLTRSISSILGISSLPDYDTICSADRKAEGDSKDTASLFPSGLAYQNAPRIGGGGGGGGGGECGSNFTVLKLIDFETGDLVGTLSGGARRPWAIRDAAACNGSSKGITAGIKGDENGGVDSESFLSIPSTDIPSGTIRMSYYYSYPRSLDRGDDFHVYVNDVLVKTYENGPGASCATECISVSANDEVKFKCKSGGNNEICSIDQIRFHGSDTDLFRI